MDEGDMAIFIADALKEAHPIWKAIGFDIGEALLITVRGEKFVISVVQVEDFDFDPFDGDREVSA